jgi:hypothetical protein
MSPSRLFCRGISSLQSQKIAIADSSNFEMSLMTSCIVTKGNSNEINLSKSKMNTRMARRYLAKILHRTIDYKCPKRKIIPVNINLHNLDIEFHLPSEDIRDTPLERFGLQIRLRRKTVGLNPLEFAKKIDLDLATLTAIEYGYSALDEVHLHLTQIAQGLEIPPAALKKYLIDLLSTANPTETRKG